MWPAPESKCTSGTNPWAGGRLLGLGSPGTFLFGSPGGEPPALYFAGKSDTECSTDEGHPIAGLVLSSGGNFESLAHVAKSRLYIAKNALTPQGAGKAFQIQVVDLQGLKILGVGGSTNETDPSYLHTLDALSACGDQVCVVGRDKQDRSFLKRFDATGALTGDVPDLQAALGSEYTRASHLSFGSEKQGYLMAYNTENNDGALRRYGLIFRLTFP